MPEERKLVTILFADVTGSTLLGDTLDPEDIRALMGRYYVYAQRIISQHGGTLEKFIGDAVMAVFGLPQAHGDDAERALAAALALHEVVTRDEILGESFQLRIGINTGEVVATSDLSNGDFLVTGDAVNVAARLQQQASPGEIVADERTAGAAQTAFLFDEPQLIEVKGKRQPLRVFPLKGPRKIRKVERPPFVGRRADLLQLSLLQARTLEERRPQLVSIVAPAGTGKTRLLEEFLQRLDPADGFQVSTVRCLPYGQTLTYWPLRGLLNGLLGEEISKTAVVNVFTGGGYKAEDASRLADFVLATLGIEGEKTADRECIFSAWRLLIEILAQQAPRILIFEDLHWASESLLDLVEYIIHLHTQAPLLLIALSRPELLDRRPNWGGGRQNFTAIALQPLNAAQTRGIVEHLMKDLPATIREQVVERSEGNPFFVLEMIRGLSERGLTGETVTLDVLPDTVHAAVLARLDLLSREEREMVQVASVLGRTFRPAMLEAVLSEYSMQEIDAAIDGLLSRDMIVPSEGGIFAFRHILVPDVAYGTLSRAERIRLHGQIAAWLESAAEERVDEYTEVIAYHYREAVKLAHQSAVPQALSVESERAVHFLRRAGELASYAGAFAEARSHLQSAIALAPESEYAGLYEQLGDCVLWGISGTEAYGKALEHWRSAGEANPLVGARLLRKLLIVYTRGFVGKRLSKEDFVKLQTEAQQLAEAAGDEDELWRIRMIELFRFSDEANLRAEEMHEKRDVGLAASAYFEQRQDWVAFSEALDGYANLSMHIGAFDEALLALKRRLAVPQLPALERGDALQMMAKTYMYLGDYENCIATIQETLAHLSPGQPVAHLGSGVSHAASAAFISGRWEEVIQFANALERIREQAQYDPSTIFIVDDGYYALLQVALAREDCAARDAASSVLTRLFPDETSKRRIMLSAMLEDDPQKIDFDLSCEHGYAVLMAVVFYSERGIPLSPSLITKIVAEHMKTDSLIRYGEIAQALANGDDDQLTRAIDDAEDHQLIVHAARMRIVLAQRTRDRSQLERARPVLERLGDRQFLCRLEEVETALGEKSKAK